MDIHSATRTDDYGTISKEFYNDDRFARALSEYNQNRPVRAGAYVNVPPIHVLKRQFPSLTGGNTVLPAGGSGTSAPTSASSAAPKWSTADPRPTTTGRATFVVPRGNGMTLQQVAQQTMGTAQRWRDIYDENPAIKPDEVLPTGTEVKLPAGVRLP
ncbi:hypothetical protein J8F10_26165 [Gemmata sp. G18]|uniref:LysM domain-containing protein n=1 Tax=Gemmata palustris TaxID=2822762 RepID=A0ABS5BYD5_9BACT|nr:hypothetical protein [Gemmata palustris]MBP3958746.1 hypothetical protein [Gemmata palustris]